MNNKFNKFIVIIASGVITYKAFKAVRYHRLQKEIYGEMVEVIENHIESDEK